MRAALETARDQVAALVGVASRQVVFTSGGTEAINAAVWAATRAAPGAPVLCAAVEHSAVRDASARAAPLEPLGVDRGMVKGLLAGLCGSASRRALPVILSSRARGDDACTASA